jgi:hypothetical protein
MRVIFEGIWRVAAPRSSGFEPSEPLSLGLVSYYFWNIMST